MTLPIAAVESESGHDGASVGSVHPATLVASDGTSLLSGFAGNDVMKMPAAAVSAGAVEDATDHADDEQTRCPATVIEAAMDANGATTVMAQTTALLPPPPTPIAAMVDLIVKQDEVRASPSPRPIMVAGRPERCELEGFTPFSKCHLWKLMMSFYDREGVESWAQGIVPHFITSNTFIAKRYSNVLRAYFRDVMRPGSEYPLDPSEPFYIVELGTGSGKFSFYFLKALAEAERVLDFPLDKIKYVMTDFTEQNFNFWKTHPALAPFVKRGIVDFAIFDATKDTELHLTVSNDVLRPHQLKNPLCIIANYLFDTLYHDLFQVEHGILKEGLISVGSKKTQEPDPLDPDIIKRLSNLYKYEQIDETFYGEENPHLNNILKWYHEYYDPESSGATVLVPIGALSAIERLSQLSSNRVVVISGDKGNSNPDHFRGVCDPHIAVHGSFSVMVNYHAIGIYFASRGGFALHSPQEEASLKVSMFVLPGEPARLQSAQDQLQQPPPTSMTELYGDDLDRVCEARSRAFPNVSVAFEDEIVAFGPNDFFVMQKAIKEDTKAPSLKAVLALLKLSCWDPDVFYKFRDVLLDHSPACPPKLKKDVRHGIPLVWKNYYALDKEKDIAFEIGRLYYGIHDYDSALAFYTRSMHEMGKHHVTSHNMGLCHYSKRQLDLAATCFEEAYALNSSYQKALTWLQRVQKELGLISQTATIGALGDNATQQRMRHEELLVQQIQLVMPDHEEVNARPSRFLSTDETSPRRRPDAAMTTTTPVGTPTFPSSSPFASSSSNSPE
uniref:Uncharacterized protein n=1 Tax=Globisporangium ultimum (strain ATCC 200006 / CBS 805.95 / DAOM BR144) TaxID=431595 RepID=K3WP22_GLOUD